MTISLCCRRQLPVKYRSYGIIFPISLNTLEQDALPGIQTSINALQHKCFSLFPICSTVLSQYLTIDSCIISLGLFGEYSTKIYAGEENSAERLKVRLQTDRT